MWVFTAVLASLLAAFSTSIAFGLALRPVVGPAVAPAVSVMLLALLILVIQFGVARRPRVKDWSLYARGASVGLVVVGVLNAPGLMSSCFALSGLLILASTHIAMWLDTKEVAR